MQFIFGLIIGAALVFGWSYTQCIPKSELAEQQIAIKECSIPLPVRHEHQSRVDEKYAEHGHGSLDQRMGTDWNQQED